MSLLPGTRINLQPVWPSPPSHLILERWRAAKFERAACARILAEIVAEHQLPDGWCFPDAILRGERFTSDALLFDLFTAERDWSWLVSNRGEPRVAADLDADNVGVVAQLIRIAAGADSPAQFLSEAAELADPDVLERLATVVGHSAQHGAWPAPDAPGIQRREHASLLLVSGKTRLLTDPQSLTASWTTHEGYPAQPRALDPDALLITHHHDDHWHLPSILAAIAADKTVLVPEVPRPNLLACESMRRSLELAEQAVLAPAWYTTHEVGGFTISALPFYGEQPTQDAPGAPAGVRNFGNTYRIDCAEWSALVLADSGRDPDGAMVDVITRSVAERGPVDVVLSCALAFPEALNSGLPDYLLTLPFAQLEQIYTEQIAGRFKPMTGGPAGTAAVCKAARARYYLPYAHGFAGLGHAPADDAPMCSAVAAELSRQSASTEVVRWRPGDVASFEKGALSIR